MNRSLVTLLLFFIMNTAFAQKEKDSLVYSLPVVNGKLTYTDSVRINGHSKAQLDSIAKKWFDGSFKFHQTCASPVGSDTASSVLSNGLLEFRTPQNLFKAVYHDYYLAVSIKIDCKEGYYTYRISDVYFRPKSGFINAVFSYPTSPDYLIDIYKKKHYGIMSMDGSSIRYYLNSVNTAIVTCIASLNKAMAN